jgi:hypothetical protein
VDWFVKAQKGPMLRCEILLGSPGLDPSQVPRVSEGVLVTADYNEVILFIVTLGRHKPRWDLYVNRKSRSKAFVFSLWRYWIGAIFCTCELIGIEIWPKGQRLCNV